MHQSDIQIDLNRDRIRTILREAYETCRVILDTSFELPVDDFVASIEPYLQSNRVSLVVTLELHNTKHPGLAIDVNLKKASVFARIPSRMRNHPKQVEINRYLKSL